MKFNAEQQKIINSRGKNLIVSAAAGSGKTTVMIERIKDIVINDHVPIKNFLVVTFTNASSEDMRYKLEKSLSQQTPTPFIMEQLEDLPTCDVSTLHSFCSKLLRQYFYEAGLDPAFEVIAEDQAESLKQKALNKLFDENYLQNNAEFYTLLDAFLFKRGDENLKKYILNLYNFFNVILDRQSWLESTLKNLYNTNLDESSATKIINSYVCGRIKTLVGLVNQKIKQTNELGLTALVEYLQNMESVLLTINSHNSFATNAKNAFEIKNFYAPPKVPLAMEHIRKQIDDFRKTINNEKDNFCKNFISPDMDKIKSDILRAKNLAVALYNATNRFEQIYTDLKREKCYLDYNDLEKYTLAVLANDQIAQALRQKYKYIFVDEYQDINAVQEKIISTIAGDTNRFMVGDIKQSIYKFRLCEPEIFLEKYYSYKNSLVGESYTLTENYRSNAQILDFVNSIFVDRMTKNFGGVDYKTEAQLVSGVNIPSQAPVTVCYLDTSELVKQKPEVLTQVYSVKNHKQEDELENIKCNAEANYIASKIKQLVAGGEIYDPKLGLNRSIKFGDISILIPARTQIVNSIIEVFDKYNIPLSTDVEEKVLDEPYVKWLYNYLKLIYNQNQDIELFSVMFGEIGNFSLEELSILRSAEANCKFFYQSMQKCLNNSTISAKLKQKLLNFDQKLQYFKDVAGYRTVKELTKEIIETFQIENLIISSADGENRILLLHKFVDSLDEANICELFSGEESEISAEKTEGINAVQLVTIHKSKGLEYPVCFLANISRQFNLNSMHSPVLISKDLGLGIDSYNLQTRTKSSSVCHEAIKVAETRRMIEENQRLLYVALTRAINKLYVVGTRDVTKLSQSFKDRPNSFADWFDACVARHIAGEKSSVNIEVMDCEQILKDGQTQQLDKVIFGAPDDNLKNLLDGIISSTYAHSTATKTPLKTSVTQIASGYHESEEEYQKYNSIKIESTDKSSTAKGNVYHKIMENINFSAQTKDLLDAELNRLISCGIISAQDLEYINKNSLLKLLNNPEFIKIVQFGKTYREAEFYMNNGAGQDMMVVQGVVDLVAIGPSGAIVVDYKTGNFSSKAALEKYKVQLGLYKTAIQRAFKTQVLHTAIVAIERGEVYFLT